MMRSRMANWVVRGWETRCSKMGSKLDPMEFIECNLRVKGEWGLYHWGMFDEILMDVPGYCADRYSDGYGGMYYGSGN